MLYGVGVSEVPNFFAVTGPGGPFANMLPSIELQGEFIAQLIEEANKRGDKTLEADAKA